MSFVIMRTSGFIREIPEEVQTNIVTYALRRINPKTGMVVFYPDGEKEEHIEDEGQTLITTIKGLTTKVYVKLDDYGSPEALRESMGKYGVVPNVPRFESYRFKPELPCLNP